MFGSSRSISRFYSKSRVLLVLLSAVVCTALATPAARADEDPYDEDPYLMNGIWRVVSTKLPFETFNGEGTILIEGGGGYYVGEVLEPVKFGFSSCVHPTGQLIWPEMVYTGSTAGVFSPFTYYGYEEKEGVVIYVGSSCAPKTGSAVWTVFKMGVFGVMYVTTFDPYGEKIGSSMLTKRPQDQDEKAATKQSGSAQLQLTDSQRKTLSDSVEAARKRHLQIGKELRMR